ncbi:MAG: DUF2791 family P-loop domain-containing protein [Candidatus Bathyarchaeota archaeon]|nr:DUF2791 family P-loop domain-containing protein [Candidatus Bathyarchaeota archaeon]
MTQNVLADPVLVGRERELSQLQRLLEAALKGRGNTVFVSGEAGAGKTRLVKEFLGQAKKQGIITLCGWCLSNAAVPYFPFFEAFNAYFSKDENHKIEIKNWLMDPPKTGAKFVTPQVWKDQTFTAAANTLAQISTKQPLILFIDDLQWADSASLALIHYLTKTVSTEPVLIVCTYRSEQLSAESEGRPHPLTETLRQMRRQDAITEITLPSLTEQAISQLAENMLGGCIQPLLAQQLAEESQGNPLFIVESLRMLNERNGLTMQNEVWRLTSDAVGIPPKIKDIILQRLSVLLRSQRNLLDVASVIGEKFDPALVAHVLGADTFEVIKTLDNIAKDTSLVRCETDLYRFDHARTRDAIYDDISPALQRVYHAKVAQTLEATEDSENMPISDLAYQFAKAGNKQKAIKYSMADGQSALAKWSNIEAAKQFRYVVEAAGEDPQYAQERLVALEGLGDAYYAGDNFKQAGAVYEQLATTKSADIKLRAIRKASHAAFYQGDVAKQKELFAKATGVVTADRLEAARITYQKGAVAGAENDWVTAFKLDFEALQVFEEEYSLADAAQILLWLGYGTSMLGQLELGVESALRSIALYDEVGDVRSELEAFAYAGGTLQACSLNDYANRMFSKAVEVNEQHKIWDYIRLIPAYVWWSMGTMSEDLAGSTAKVLKALEYCDKTDARLYYGAIHGVLIIAHAFASDIPQVDRYYARLMSLPPYILSNGPSQVYLAPMMGVYHAAKGDFEQSTKYFNQMFEVIKATFPNPFLEASTRQLYAWALGKAGKAEDAQTQLNKAQKVIEAAHERFSHVNVHANLMTLSTPPVNEAFPVRIDLVNVSSSEGSIVKVDGLFTSGLELMDVPIDWQIEDGVLTFIDNKISAFQVKTIKLTMKAPQIGMQITLKPQVTYQDELGQLKTCSPRPITLTLQEPSKVSQIIRPDSDVSGEGEAEIDILKRFGLPR